MVSASGNQQGMLEHFESKLAYADSTLPFLQIVVDEIDQLTTEHRTIISRLAEIGHHRQLTSHDDLYSEELKAVETSADELKDRISECYEELNQVEGLSFDRSRTSFVDFPTETDLGQISFCWKLGERKVAHWHWASETCESRKSLTELTELVDMSSSSLPA